MEHRLLDVGIKLTCLRTAHQLTEIYRQSILSDLMDVSAHGNVADPAIAQLFNHDLSDCDFSVTASDLKTGKVKAVLGMTMPALGMPNRGASNSDDPEEVTETEQLLQLKIAYVAPALRGRGIMRRMVALALLRIACFADVPKVIVARTASPVWYRSLRQLSSGFTGAVFFPDHNSPTIRMDSVRLAKQVVRQVAPILRFESGSGILRGGNMTDGAAPARPVCNDPLIQALFGLHLKPADQMLVVIDLRSQSEDTILSDAKRVYRARKPVSAISPSSEFEVARPVPEPIRRSR
jgi:hypothetical protein